MSRSFQLSRNHALDMAKIHADLFMQDDAWDTAAIEDLLALPTTHARGIRADNALVAFIIVQFIPPEAEILTLATASSFQRRGLAGQLIDDLQNELAPQGLQKWLLDVAADNLSAVAFYRKKGFQEDGRRPGYYKRLEGTRIDAILMSKPLAGQETK